MMKLSSTTTCAARTCAALTLGLSTFLGGCITVQSSCSCDQGREHDAGHVSMSSTAVSSAAAPVLADARVELPPDFEPPPLLKLASIPRKRTLIEGNDGVLAVFEVDGDALVGVAYRKKGVAKGALGLWRELVLRIPTNQREDLVQFQITKAKDPAGNTDNSGTGSQTGRFGYVLSFSQSNLEKNQKDIDAPLSGHRGTYDWTLIHEFGHLRMYADGAVDDFIEAFGNERGAGEGYPEQGTPRLDGNWVSSYAERAGGDEDCAESFTAFVMLDALPEGDSEAARKVRWFAERPGYPELRRALRITEPDGSSEPLQPAPRAEFPLVVEPASWMLGTWSGTLEDGTRIVYEISSEDIVRERFKGRKSVERWSYRNLRDIDPLATVDLYESNETFYLHQVSVAGTPFSESFRKDGHSILVDNERLGGIRLER